KAAVFEAPVDGKRPARKLGEGRHIAWSHDGTRLAYIDTQLVVVTLGGASRQLTQLAGYLTDPAWSPDDARIAVLFAEHAAGGGGPIEAQPVETGVSGAAIHNQRLTVVDARSGAPKQISPPDRHVYEFDWTPDAK